MTKHLMVLLIAIVAGLFQSLAEHVSKVAIKEVGINEIAPSWSGWPRELVCRTDPDGPTRCYTGGAQPALEPTPDQKSWKAVCHPVLR